MGQSDMHVKRHRIGLAVSKHSRRLKCAERASVRHTDACYSQDAQGTDRGAPPSWLMSDSQGRRWQTRREVPRSIEKTKSFMTASLLGGTRQRRRRFGAPSVGRDQGRRHCSWRSPDDRNWRWIPDQYHEHRSHRDCAQRPHYILHGILLESCKRAQRRNRGCSTTRRRQPRESWAETLRGNPRPGGQHIPELCSAIADIAKKRRNYCEDTIINIEIARYIILMIDERDKASGTHFGHIDARRRFRLLTRFSVRVPPRLSQHALGAMLYFTSAR